MFKQIRRSIWGGGSGTAYGPLLGRWAMHKAGTRPDPACEALLRVLPALPPRIWERATGSSFDALRRLGIEPAVFDYPVRRPSSLATFINHRTEFLDTALREQLDAVAQVVILGAGWDTRCYGMLKGRGLRLFEVDSAETQPIKLNALRRAEIAHDHVVFVSADFNRESWLDALERNGFDPALPSFFLWEGVTYYLDADAIAKTLQTVAQRCAQGSFIAFDYPSLEVVNGEGLVGMRTALRFLERIGEPWTYGISTAAPARQPVETLLTQNGLRLLRHEPMGVEPWAKRPFGGVALAAN